MTFWWQAAALATSMLFTNTAIGLKIGFLGSHHGNIGGRPIIFLVMRVLWNEQIITSLGG